jgi:hypothetical protein
VRPLVFLGSISYPLYLWHWPIIVFYRMFHYTSGSVGALVPIPAAVLLAWGTRDLIENPARFGRFWGKTVRVPPIRVFACGLAFTGLLGASAVATQGYPSRYSPRLRAIANAPSSLPKYEPYRVNQCYFHPGATAAFSPGCTPAKRVGVPLILLWGDSHAAHLYPGLLSLQSNHDIDVIQWTAAGCPPTLTRWVAEQPGCEERRRWELRQLGQLTPDTALLAARWDLYLSGGVSQDQIVAAMRDDIQWLRQRGVHNIVLFGPGPSWNTALAAELVSYMKLWNTEQIPARLSAVSAAAGRLDTEMQTQALAMHAQYVSVLRVFCNRQGCLTVGNRQSTPPDLLFWDSDHLTQSGSRFLVDAASDQILPPTR